MFPIFVPYAPPASTNDVMEWVKALGPALAAALAIVGLAIKFAFDSRLAAEARRTEHKASDIKLRLERLSTIIVAIRDVQGGVSTFLLNTKRGSEAGVAVRRLTSFAEAAMQRIQEASTTALLAAEEYGDFPDFVTSDQADLGKAFFRWTRDVNNALTVSPKKMQEVRDILNELGSPVNALRALKAVERARLAKVYDHRLSPPQQLVLPAFFVKDSILAPAKLKEQLEGAN